MLNKYIKHAFNHVLSSYPEDADYNQVIEAVVNGYDTVQVWELYDGFADPEELAFLIDDIIMSCVQDFAIEGEDTSFQDDLYSYNCPLIDDDELDELLGLGE